MLNDNIRNGNMQFSNIGELYISFFGVIIFRLQRCHFHCSETSFLRRRHPRGEHTHCPTYIQMPHRVVRNLDRMWVQSNSNWGEVKSSLIMECGLQVMLIFQYFSCLCDLPLKKKIEICFMATNACTKCNNIIAPSINIFFKLGCLSQMYVKDFY